jgi:glutamyl-Q tRNA(Asp) synthetase
VSYNKFNTRFAPSPSGYLHLGNAYSAMFAERAAREENGQFFLRIEDIDRQRCRPEFEESIKEDLDWLGLKWEKPVHRQSDHL